MAVSTSPVEKTSPRPAVVHAGGRCILELTDTREMYIQVCNALMVKVTAADDDDRRDDFLLFLFLYMVE